MSWAMVAVGGISAAGAVGAAALSRGGKGTSGVIPPRVEMIADYPWMTDLYEQGAGYFGDQFGRWGEFYGGGEIPPYLQRGSEAVRGMLERPLEERMYGRPGERSGSRAAEAEALGARMGTGGKGAVSPVIKAQSQYEADMKAIDNEIMKYVLDEGYRQTQLATQGTQALPQGQRFATLGGMSYQTPEKPNYMAQGLQAIGQNMPWENIFPGKTTPPPEQKPYGAGMSYEDITNNPTLWNVPSTARLNYSNR